MVGVDGGVDEMVRGRESCLGCAKGVRGSTAIIARTGTCMPPR